MRLERILALAALAAAGALANPAVAEDFKAPEGKVVVHYNRPDANYDGWGLHVWESFQAKEEASDEWATKQSPDMPVMKVTWFKPLPQSGRDDFGVYWVLDVKDFGNGRVNYIIHKGDKKEQANQDKFFMIKDGRDAYVNSGDTKVYMSKEEALKARKK